MKLNWLLLAVIFGSPWNSLSQPLPDSVTTKLHEATEGFRNRYHSPSIVIAIVRGDQIIFQDAKGYVDLENKIPASINSPYPILSVTKMFTATMLMQLVQRNIVRLDDDISKYVPEFKSNGKGKTTLLQLATHTSGLPRNSPADIELTKQIDRWILTNDYFPTLDPATLKDFLKSLPFITKAYPEYETMPGGDRRYSNLGYSLLGIGLERAATRNYANYIINNICQPLKMSNTGFDNQPLPASLAKGYYYDDSSKSYKATPMFISNSAIYAGGMHSTVTDLARFISFQFAENAAADRVLSQTNRAMMRALRIGWRMAYPYVLHEGSMLGYRSEIVVNPETKLGWVVLTNASNFEFGRLNEYFHQLLSPVFEKKSPSSEDFVGQYVLEGGYDSLRIFLRDAKLYSTYLQGTLPETALTQTGKSSFRGLSRGDYHIGYDFVLDRKAKVIALNMGQLIWRKRG